MLCGHAWMEGYAAGRNHVRNRQRRTWFLLGFITGGVIATIIGRLL
jgi:hypothetical protein